MLGSNVGVVVVPPPVIAAVPETLLRDQLRFPVPAAVNPEIVNGFNPLQLLSGVDPRVTVGFSSQVIIRSSVIVGALQAAGGTEVNLTVRTPVGEVGVKPQVVGSVVDPVIIVPVPDPPASKAQPTVEPAVADELVKYTEAFPHWPMSVPAEAVGDASQVKVIKSVSLEHGEAPNT